MQIIDGWKIQKNIKKEISREVASMVDKNIRTPHIAAIVIGDHSTVDNSISEKEKLLSESGFLFSIYKNPSNISEVQLTELIQYLNMDDEVDGLIIDHLLPAHYSLQKIVDMIVPSKDVEGLHSVNIDRYKKKKIVYLQSLPFMIREIILHYHIDLKDKNILIAYGNHSKSDFELLSKMDLFPDSDRLNCCHFENDNFLTLCLQADVVITDIGKPDYLQGNMFKPDAVVIDMGKHKLLSKESESGYVIAGDVSFRTVSKKKSLITKYSDSIEPMLYLNLLINGLKAAKKEISF